MSKKDFQNGFALGSIISGASETKVKLLENTVTFLVNDEPYEIVGIQNGESINAPATTPKSSDAYFKGWYDGDTFITFPYTPTADKEFVAVFDKVVDKIYNKFGVDKEQYPLLAMSYKDSSYELEIWFFKDYEQEANGIIKMLCPILTQTFTSQTRYLYNQRVDTVTDYILTNITPALQEKNEGWNRLNISDELYTYTSFECDARNSNGKMHYIIH